VFDGNVDVRYPILLHMLFQIMMLCLIKNKLNIINLYYHIWGFFLFYFQISNTWLK